VALAALSQVTTMLYLATTHQYLAQTLLPLPLQEVVMVLVGQITAALVALAVVEQMVAQPQQEALELLDKDMLEAEALFLTAVEVVVEQDK
jgi:TRAP-type C4-dicarboxylate transport system permease small subunit